MAFLFVFFGIFWFDFRGAFSGALWSHGRLTILPNGSFLLLPLAVVSTSQGCLLVLVLGSRLTLLRRQHTPRTLPLMLLGQMEKLLKPIRASLFRNKNLSKMIHVTPTDVACSELGLTAVEIDVAPIAAMKLEKIARIERLSARERDSRNQSTKKTHATYCPNQRARRYMRVYL